MLSYCPQSNLLLENSLHNFKLFPAWTGGIRKFLSEFMMTLLVGIVFSIMYHTITCNAQTESAAQTADDLHRHHNLCNKQHRELRA
jgi:hypothetical protein